MAQTPVLRVGFVNDVSDDVFVETYRRFAKLLRPRARQLQVEVSRYWIASAPRADAVRARASRNYQDLDALYRNPPDALLIAGPAPYAGRNSDEPYSEDVARLLRWAEAKIPSTMLSCTASRAAVRVLDGIVPKQLPSAQFGLFLQSVDETRALGRGLGPLVAFPQSRVDEIPVKELTIYGYRPVVYSAQSGWSVATRERDGRLLVLLQCHPEYERTTLLEEYERDLNSYVRGSGAYPEIPVGYLDVEGTQILEALGREAGHLSARRDAGTSPIEFPSDEVSGHIESHWDRASFRLFANWMQEAHRRSRVAAA